MNYTKNNILAPHMYISSETMMILACQQLPAHSKPAMITYIYIEYELCGDEYCGFHSHSSKPL